jgi:hypothetical protein
MLIQGSISISEPASKGNSMITRHRQRIAVLRTASLGALAVVAVPTVDRGSRDHAGSN